MSVLSTTDMEFCLGSAGTIPCETLGRCLHCVCVCKQHYSILMPFVCCVFCLCKHVNLGCRWVF